MSVTPAFAAVILYDRPITKGGLYDICKEEPNIAKCWNKNHSYIWLNDLNICQHIIDRCQTSANMIQVWSTLHQRQNIVKYLTTFEQLILERQMWANIKGNIWTL